MGIGIDEAWGLTMAEFMKIFEAKKVKSDEPDILDEDEAEALVDNLRAQGIIDDKGLVRHG